MTIADRSCRKRRLSRNCDITGQVRGNALNSEVAGLVDVSWQEGARLIDACTYLFAIEVRELEELTLSLTLVEAKAQAPITATEVSGPLAALRLGSSPIEQDETCRMFEVIFDRKHMISYTVLNESYGRYPQPPEVFTGKLFRVFSRSHQLEFTERTTYASGGHPARLIHFEIVCLNHVFDVIATAPPKIAVGNNPIQASVVS